MERLQLWNSGYLHNTTVSGLGCSTSLGIPFVALFNACEDCSLCDDQNVDSSEANGRLHVFAVPRTMVKPFNSDTISVIANFAKLRRAEQTLLLGAKWEEGGDTNEPLAHGKYLDVMRRLYHFIQQEKPYFDERIEPRHLFDRVRAQSGAFLISAFHDRYENDEFSSGMRVSQFTTITA